MAANLGRLLVLVLLDHYVWFRHFTDAQIQSYRQASYYEPADVPSFTMIASYFGICVWFVPFCLFVSLSAGDNVLPTMSTEPARSFDGSVSKPQGMVKAVVDNIRSTIGEILGTNNKLDRP